MMSPLQYRGRFRKHIRMGLGQGVFLNLHPAALMYLLLQAFLSPLVAQGSRLKACLLSQRGKAIAQADCHRVGAMLQLAGGSRGQKSIFAFPGFVKYADVNGIQ